MNIHKINSTSKEHQNFLAQNRIDPITGDSILEGDEVVFCVSCKSVFLKDTWEYLGNRHCEQSETLVALPVDKIVYLKSEPKIAFHSTLPSTNGWINSIPNLNKSTWKHKGRKLSKYDDLPYILILVGFVIGGGSWAITQNFLSFLISILFTFLVLGLRNSYNKTKSKEIQTFHKNFTTNTFYITDRTVGFSSEFGMEEWFLEVAKLDSIYFWFLEVRSDVDSDGSYSVFYSYECCIKDKMGVEAKFPIKNYLKQGTRTTAKPFLKSLHYLSENFDIHIEVQTNITNGQVPIKSILPRNSKIKISDI